MESNDPGLLRDIILWLYRNQERLERESQGALSSDIRGLYELIALGCKKIESESALEEIVQGSEGILKGPDGKSRYIYLEPTHNQMVPIFSFAYDWGCSVPKFDLRVGLFLLDKAANLAGMGFRFESPSGNTHHFHHAQPILALESDPLPQWPKWIPERQPSFVLDATDPITLLVCMLISFYGYDYFETLTSAPFKDDLKGHLSGRMVLMNPEFQPTYWRVDYGRETKFYMTRHEPKKFKLLARSQRKAQKIEEIHRREYFALDERKREIL